MLWLKIVASLCLSAAAVAAQAIAAGTALPVMLDSTLKAASDKPGQKIEGKLMQEVALPSGLIKTGARITGHVVSVTKPGGSGSQIAVAFEQLEDHGVTYPLKVYVRALATMESVAQAQQPTDASSGYESSNQWFTQQIGGETVDRPQGYLTSGNDVVGKWVSGVVLGKLRPNPARGCKSVGLSDQQQALWIFSTTACGIYGNSELKLANSGEASGQVVVRSGKDVLVRGGSGWLLIVE